MKRVGFLLIVAWLAAIGLALAEEHKTKTVEGQVKQINLDEKKMILIIGGVEVRFHVDKKTKFLYDNTLAVEPEKIKKGDPVVVTYYVEKDKNYAIEVNRLKKELMRHGKTKDGEQKTLYKKPK